MAGETRPFLFMDPVTQLIAIRDGYLTALAVDALNPKFDYNIDGQAVTRSSWRESLFKELANINQLINMYQPYEIQTIMVN